ncbi:MAG: class I SAM-dependent methyltransferase [Minisyncoccia bacterium]
MSATSRSKELWGPNSLELKVLKGKGIDIGPSSDPVFPNVQMFDKENGDANEITKYVHDQFDYVYSSHCLEHMHDPKKALLDWWKLVKPGGYLFFTVPDEDLYEQGVFPSRFNPDHKATFTLSKTESWSPCSINVLDLGESLPGGEIIRLALQDYNYDRNLMTWGPRCKSNFIIKALSKNYYKIRKRLKIRILLLEKIFLIYEAFDQTLENNALAQIQCIVKKTSI